MTLALAIFCALLPTYLLRFTIPFPFIGALPSTVLELLFGALFIAWLATDGRKKESWAALRAWRWPIALFMLGATIGIFVSGNPRGALGVWRAYFVEPILFFAMFANIVATSERRKWIMIALGTALTVIGVTAIFQKITGFGIPAPWQAAATRRVTSFYGFPNAIGLFAAPIIVLVAGWAVGLARVNDRSRRPLAIVPLIAALLGVLACLFAVSKGALVGTAAGVATIGLMDKRLRTWTIAAMIAGALVFAAVPSTRQLAVSLATLHEKSSSVRAIIWKETENMLADHPLFGAGLDGYQTGIVPYHKAKWIEIFMYPHDVILNFWSETGLLGLAGFLWIVIRFFAVAAAFMKKKPTSWIVPGAVGAMVALVVHGTVDVPYFKNDLAFLFWIIVGIVESSRQSFNKKDPA